MNRTSILRRLSGASAAALRPGRGPACGLAALGAAILVLTGGLPAGAAVLDVPGQYPTIQAAIDAAHSHDVIRIDAGVYQEQLDIAKSLTLRGEDPATTIVQSPALLAVRFSHESVDYRPIVYVHGGVEVEVTELAIDGAAQGDANPGFAGIAFHNAGGSLSDMVIAGLSDSPFSAADHGIAVLARNAGGVARELAVNDCRISGYQEAGLSASGSGLSVELADCWIAGPGEEGGLSAPIGVRVADGAAAAIQDNHIYFNASSGPGCGPDLLGETQGAALMLAGASPSTLVLDNFLVANDVGIRCQGPGEVETCFLLDNRYAGLVLAGGDHSVTGINVQGTHRVGIAVLGTEGPCATNLTECCLSGPGGNAADGGIVGVWAYGGGSPVDVQVAQCGIMQWSVGLKPEGSAHLNAVHSVIAANTLAGYDNTATGLVQEASLNWWGIGAGPVPELGGDRVLGSAVATTPVRIEEHDTALTCGLQPREGVIGFVPPAECLSDGSPVLAGISCVLNRVDTTPARGFTVIFELSEELALAGASAGIHEGTFLSDGFATSFTVQPVGNNAYAVEGYIIGEPCGATAAGGTLFTVDIERGAAMPGETGLISVHSVTLEGCAGQGLDATAGPAATVGVCAMASVGEDPVQPAAASARLMLAAQPNPFGIATLIRFGLPAGGPAAVRIHDAAGRLVRVLLDGPVAAGPHTLIWDGRAEGGLPAPAGVYLCNLQAGQAEQSVKLYRLR